MTQGYTMPSGKFRRFSIRIESSPVELGWLIAAVFSVGVVVGLGMAFAALTIGGSPCLTN